MPTSTPHDASLTNSYPCQIVDWMAWSPERENRETWLQWAKSPTEKAAAPQVESKAPAVSFVPAGLRRRMSALNKMALFSAYHCLSRANQTPARIVFASRHGELHRTQQLLQAIATSDALSPTQFSLSVHNTTAGLFSIANRNTSPGTAIAAGRDTWLFALLEAIGWLQNRRGELILLTIADQPLPAAYQPFAERGDMAYAASFLLSAQADITAHGTSPRGPMQPVTLQLHPQAAIPATPSPTPTPADLLRWLLQENTPAPLYWTTQQQAMWQWRRDGNLT